MDGSKDDDALNSLESCHKEFPVYPDTSPEELYRMVCSVQETVNVEHDRVKEMQRDVDTLRATVKMHNEQLQQETAQCAELQGTLEKQRITVSVKRALYRGIKQEQLTAIKAAQIGEDSLIETCQRVASLSVFSEDLTEASTADSSTAHNCCFGAQIPGGDGVEMESHSSSSLSMLCPPPMPTTAEAEGIVHGLLQKLTIAVQTVYDMQRVGPTNTGVACGAVALVDTVPSSVDEHGAASPLAAQRVFGHECFCERSGRKRISFCEERLERVVRTPAPGTVNDSPVCIPSLCLLSECATNSGQVAPPAATVTANEESTFPSRFRRGRRDCGEGALAWMKRLRECRDPTHEEAPSPSLYIASPAAAYDTSAPPTEAYPSAAGDHAVSLERRSSGPSEVGQLSTQVVVASTEMVRPYGRRVGSRRTVWRFKP